MTASKNSLPIALWIAEGKDRGATHLLVVYNGQTSNYEAVYVMPGENLQRKESEYSTGWFSVLTNYEIY
ncbi:hypothetical protein NIES22_73300 (plasmid) [Calothrix brevissima NIES-22]|nr:hypothetical protein NIES22_73300 [Calothrix brevissima NIES-22]